MKKLRDILLEPARRPVVVNDCVQLVESEVASKGGLTGIAIKGAYAVVKAIKPGMIQDAVDHLVDDFVVRLEPFYEAQQSQGGNLEAYLNGRSTEVANALLGVTDDKATRAKNATLKKTYEKLRPTALKHVEAAVPGVARVIDKHARA